MNSWQSGENLKCSWINLHFVLQKSFQNLCSAQKAKMKCLYFFLSNSGFIVLYLILFWPCNLDSVSRHLLELLWSKSRTRIICFESKHLFCLRHCSLCSIIMSPVHIMYCPWKKTKNNFSNMTIFRTIIKMQWIPTSNIYFP